MVLGWDVDLEIPSLISELNSAIAFLSTRNAIALQQIQLLERSEWPWVPRADRQVWGGTSRLKNAIALFSSEMCGGASKSTSHPKTMIYMWPLSMLQCKRVWIHRSTTLSCISSVGLRPHPPAIFIPTSEVSVGSHLHPQLQMFWLDLKITTESRFSGQDSVSGKWMASDWCRL